MKNNKQQTAVEWFNNKILSYKHSTNINGTDYIMIPINKVEHLKQQAREMEKEQMELIYNGILQNVGTSIKQSDLPTFEEYYEQTYGGNK